MNIQKAFQLLELKENASADEAKQAYIACVKKYHPDQFQDDPEKQKSCEETLKEINIAYAQLKAFFKEKPAAAQPGKSQTASSVNRQNGSKPNASQSKYHHDIPKYTSAFSDAFKAFWSKVSQKTKTFKPHHDSAQQHPDRSKNQPHSSTHKPQTSQSFKHVLEEVEARMRKDPSATMSNRNDFVNVRRKKTAYQNIGRWQKNAQDTDRVEPVSRIKRVGKIGEDN